MNVWCTLVMLDESYACGAAVVAQSLRKVGTKYPICCMYSEGISADCVQFLESQFDFLVKVPLIRYPVPTMKSKKQEEIYSPWINASFTKWNVLNPELFPYYNKIMLLDADMIFLENCDELFELNTPALTFSSAWAKPYVTGKFGTPNPYGEMKHGQVVPRDQIIRAFNGSVVGLACMALVQPTAAAWDACMRLLKCEQTYGNSKCVSGFDEQLIAETYLTLGAPMYHIHQQYNWVVGKYNWLLNGEKPKTQQYYRSKPWHESPTATEWQDVRDWWKVFDEVVEKNNTAKRFLRIQV